jgi:hypothetical protein
MKYTLIALLAISLNAYAGISDAPQIVARQLEQSLNQMQNPFAGNDQINAPILYKGSDETAYYLKRFRLQLTAFAAFDISLFKLKVTPFLEFRWMRKNPKGWENYKAPTH